MSAAVWELELLSWTGITVRAKHTYAILRDEDAQRIEIKWKIDQATADEYNRESPEAASISPWRAGEESSRFSSREDAQAAAVAHWRTIAKPGDLLVHPYTREIIAKLEKRSVRK